MAIFRLGQRIPEIDPQAWVHEQASVIGSVFLSEEVSVWPQAVLRGDTEPLRIGRGTNIQDGSVLHADPGKPLEVGAFVTVGHQVMLHGCTIGEGTLVGIQSVILNGARIGRNCLIGAGALITEDKTFPDESLIFGSPAKLVRRLTPSELARLKASADVYIARARQYRTELVKLS
jgi:carbonic anhydrase/acetyltransferase-like protein (isoleucine patch superfamily)